MWEVAKPETGSRFATLWSPFFKINMTSQLRRRSSDLHKIWLASAESQNADDGEGFVETESRI